MTYEKTADELEMAEHVREQLTAQGRKACADALRPQTVGDSVVTHCANVDCGEALPPVRIAMKRIRCTYCQAEHDRLVKLGRRP